MRLVLVLFCLLLPLPSAAGDYLGKGNMLCLGFKPTWMDKQAIDQWMIGYITGMDSGPYLPTEGQTHAEMYNDMVALLNAFIRAHCAAYPQDKVGDALLDFRRQYTRSTRLCPCTDDKSYLYPGPSRWATEEFQ